MDAGELPDAGVRLIAGEPAGASDYALLYRSGDCAHCAHYEKKDERGFHLVWVPCAVHRLALRKEEGE